MATSKANDPVVIIHQPRTNRRRQPLFRPISRHQRQNPGQLRAVQLAGQGRPQRHEQVFTLDPGTPLQIFDQRLINCAMFGIGGQRVTEKTESVCAINA